MRTGSSVRSAGSEVRVATAVARLFGALLGLLALDDADAHLGEHRVDVLDLV
jgi:hypothetical protein